MIYRLLAVSLLVAWQVAMLVLTQSDENGLVGAGLSLLVGGSLIALLVAMAEHEPPSSDEDAQIAALLIPIH